MWMYRIHNNLRSLYTNRLSLVQSSLYHTDNGVYGAPRISEKPLTKDLKVYEDYRVHSLVAAYRKHGYLIANTDVLNRQKINHDHPELNAQNYGIEANAVHNASDLLHCTLHTSHLNTQELLSLLQDIYCGPIAAEFQHMQSLEEREWFAERFEKSHEDKLSDGRKVQYAQLMLQSQAFEHFLAAKFPTVKRYGGEGAESAIIFYHLLFQLAVQEGISDIVMSSGHRGRLNLCTLLLQFPLATLFTMMGGLSEQPSDVRCTGDALLHIAPSADVTHGGKKVHVSMIRTPSHLEVCNAVAAGKARARMQSLSTSFYQHQRTQPSSHNPVLCFQVHGDAAFTGQGVIAETFSLANLDHYSVGGTVHFIINNQIGYTTEADRGRSSTNCSDIGKMIDCPVLRVNADHPESIAQACGIALGYRQAFQKDIIVDFICYRKWGHNEVDEPSFTQPLMYHTIRSRPNIPDAYAMKIVEEGVCGMDVLQGAVQEWTTNLSHHYKLSQNHIPKANHLEGAWKGMVQATNHVTTWDTGVDLDLLKFIAVKSVTLPEDFTAHSTLKRSHIERRLERVAEGVTIDWATAEALAIGSLLMQGVNVRMSGQDVGRGTFSQRHAMLIDQRTDEAFVPLNSITPSQSAFFEVANSPLSEEAVLAFEFGFSIENAKSLVLWEAQFGDFFNGAQIVIDTYVAGSETKWLLHSGLVLLLPHGMDGAGPEHSSCHFERFLQSTDSKEAGVDGDDVNMQVVYPTTPAQIFHILRRQMVRNFRKPCVVVGPKGLLRLAQATSSLQEMAPGSHFRPVISDDSVASADVKKVVFLSGKHYYTLLSQRQERKIHDTALVRIESLCPFPAAELQEEMEKYKGATRWVWSQEEHRNQGAWSFINPRFRNVVGVDLQYCGRTEAATPAVGVSALHDEEVKQVNDDTFS